jgi:hypothetical protein
MKTSNLFSFLICILFGQFVWSGNWEFPSSVINEVLVTGSGVNLQVNQGPADSTIKVTVGGSQENQWLSSVDGNRIKVQNLGTFNNSNNSGSSGGQETNIQIQLPPGKKMIIGLNEGRVNLGPQVGSLFIRILKGQVTAQKTTEILQIFIQKGNVVVESHQGDLKIESYAAKIMVKNSQGSLDITNFMGETILEKPNSRVNIQSRFGNAKILGSKAGVNFDWGQGQLSVVELAGRCEGNLENGSLIVNALVDSEIEVNAIKGKVQVSLPNSSGAWLNLRTSSNELIAPSPLKSAKDAKYSFIKGRLSGTNKGSVIIHGEETSVIVR